MDSSPTPATAEAAFARIKARAPAFRHAFAAVSIPAPGRGLQLVGPEMDAARGMGPARLAEFTSGRIAARQAMAAMGHVPCAVPMNLDRSPQWPQGLRGSLSHGISICVAVVTPQDTSLAPGIDVEPDMPLHPELWPTIFSPREQNWLDRTPDHNRGQMARAGFSAKEAVYKAQYQVSGELIDFRQVTLTPTTFPNSFHARITLVDGPPLEANVLFQAHQGLILSLAWMPALEAAQ